MRELLSGLSDRRLRRRALRSETNLPQAAQRYVCLSRLSLGGRAALRGRLVVVDTETTGLEPGRDRLLSIGGVAVVDGEVRPSDSIELVLQGPEVGAATALVHGMTRGDLRAGTPPVEALCQFLDWVGMDLLVAHHLAFDRAMLNGALAEYLPPLYLRNRGLDTVRLAQRLEQPISISGAPAPPPPGSGRYTLDAQCATHGIRVVHRHHAVGDALATATLLVVLLHKLRRRGLTELSDLLRS